MEIKQSWKARLTFKNATILLCLLNLVTALLLLQGFLSSSSRKLSITNPNSVQLRYIKESNELRRAMQPSELIKIVKQIEEVSHTEPEIVQQKDAKQIAATDLSKRLKDFRSFSDAASLKALEEWRKRKMDRAKQRELEKNGTLTSHA